MVGRQGFVLLEASKSCIKEITISIESRNLTMLCSIRWLELTKKLFFVCPVAYGRCLRLC